MPRDDRKKGRNGCWRGKGDPTPFVPGLPEEVPAARSLADLFAAMLCCTRCELAKERTQVVVGTGPEDARLMFVGEAPGAEEDRQGRPFVGAAGRLLNRLLQANGLRRDDVFITNMVACRPPSNRAPRAREVRAHAPWLEEQIRLVKPRLITTLGRSALAYFIPGAKVTQLRGIPQTIERDGRTMTLLPLLHPAAALRAPDLLPALEADFAKVPDLLARAGDGR